MEFIEGKSTVKLIWACCSDCGDGVEVQYVPERDRDIDVSDTRPLTFREAASAREDWKSAHRKACNGPVRLLEAVPA